MCFEGGGECVFVCWDCDQSTICGCPTIKGSPNKHLIAMVDDPYEISLYFVARMRLQMSDTIGNATVDRIGATINLIIVGQLICPHFFPIQKIKQSFCVFITRVSNRMSTIYFANRGLYINYIDNNYKVLASLSTFV